MFEFTALSPVGARITGFRLDEVDGPAVAAMSRLLADHGVLVMPGQDVDDDVFLSFLRRFGPTMFTAGETPVSGYPELNVVSNIGRSTPPRSTFHTDTSYVRNPPIYTALRAVEVPERGGHTLFTNQYAAYDTLPVGIRELLLGRELRHVVSGLDLGPDEETSATHPIICRHPISGRSYLYMSTPQRCSELSGVVSRESVALVANLFDHCTRDDNVYRHAWSPGDVVMWDNRCVLHCADHSDVVGDRVMHRGMVAATTS
jgi:alpha-ketoglutarate-dependent taurine dioxygenase